MGWARGADKEAGPGRALSVSSEQQPNIDFASFFVRFTTVIHMVWKFCLGLRHVVFTTSCLRESKVSDPDGSVNTYGLRRLASPSLVPDPVNTHLFMVKVRLVGRLPSLTTSHVRMQGSTLASLLAPTLYLYTRTYSSMASQTVTTPACAALAYPNTRTTNRQL
jgi:hypothetical protein